MKSLQLLFSNSNNRKSNIQLDIAKCNVSNQMGGGNR